MADSCHNWGAEDVGSLVVNSVLPDVVKTNLINKTVKLHDKLEDARFTSPLAAVDRDTYQTTDLVDTSF